MKKFLSILFGLMLCMSMPLFLGINVKASNDISVEALNDLVVDKLGAEVSYNDRCMESINTHYQNEYPDNEIVVYYYNSKVIFVVNDPNSGSFTISGNTISHSGVAWSWNNQQASTTPNHGTYGNSWNLDNVIYCQNYTEFADLANGYLIDTSTFTFDPSIPYPVMVTDKESYRLSLDGIGGYTGGIVSTFAPVWNFYDYYLEYEEEFNEQLYFYATIRIYAPTTFNYYSDNSGRYVEYKNYVNSGVYALYPREVLHPLPDTGFSISYEDTQIERAFIEYLESINPTYTGETTYTVNYESGNSTVIDNTEIDNKYRFTPLHCGNRLEFNCCYFAIRDGELYCGQWTRWVSTQPYKESINNFATDSNYVISSYSGQISPEVGMGLEEQDETYVPSNVPQYENNVNVNIGNSEQNVPNNQNYPTIVSYNHDNIFATFVDTYTTAGTMLDSFDNFLADTFTWIPGEIWYIVAMGFAASIVIMIIKIL